MAIETTGMQRDDVTSTTGEHLLRVQQKPMPLLPGLLGTTHKKWMTSLILQDNRKIKESVANHLFQLRLQFMCF
jgi:hypothetical protein